MDSSLFVAMALGVAILVASMISVEIALSVSVIEIVLGVALGNMFDLTTPDWLVFLASFGSVVLTFLAGAEVDPGEFRANWKPSLLMGAFPLRRRSPPPCLPAGTSSAGTGRRLRSAASHCPPRRWPWCTPYWWSRG